ncbi:hypothetical protein [Jeotgalibacillus soli]|uniref:Transposase n=1 Tax=Jeotgalibacillus soli TaxID=889306 RepID=A0A0C2VSA0_9BACL|nr:hypothetical protein [Jeotgalibacillus soli]KIL51802.1 hypothetical protein KP78_01720 [Jeotgalibacillus soli]
MTKRERRTFTAAFKKQMVQLCQNGKTKLRNLKQLEKNPFWLIKMDSS